MGNGFDPTLVGFIPDRSEADSDVGEDYCVIGPDLLIEKGDEYLDERGCFVPFPLEAVGRRVAPGMLARRPIVRS